MTESNESTLLDIGRLYSVTISLKAANVLYHALGGNDSHTVISHQLRHTSIVKDCLTREAFSCDLLAKGPQGYLHMMSIQILDDLSEIDIIEEHPRATIWEFMHEGKECIGRATSLMHVYFTNQELPNKKSVCTFGFPMLKNDISISSEYPVLVISTAVDDGSDFAKLAQYLDNPDPENAEYGALSRWAKLIK